MTSEHGKNKKEADLDSNNKPANFSQPQPLAAIYKPKNQMKSD
jgi:hypothetical protein